MTPGEFIKHTRLKEAARLLTSTNLNVSEIFFRTGFNNQSYFFREFKNVIVVHQTNTGNNIFKNTDYNIIHLLLPGILLAIL